jgi:hypothetical protein
MSYFANHEAPVHDLMNDPIVRLVMERDGFTPEAVWALIEDARRKCAAGTAHSTSSPEA